MRRRLREMLGVLGIHQFRESYSLYGLDKKIEPYLRQRKGFFVEAGANNGISQSNTLYFEKYLGWRGLLVEAVPRLAERCRLYRPKCIVKNCALVSRDYEGETAVIHYRNLMSLVTGGGLLDELGEEEQLQRGLQYMDVGDMPEQIEVPAMTISDLLDAHDVPDIDLFSLDVEGYELEVLRGLDFERHCPRFLLVEVHDRQRIGSFLEPWMEEVAFLHNKEDRHCDILYGRRQ